MSLTLTDQQANISVMDRAANITAYDRITVDPGQMGGQPAVRGMRLTVRRVLEAIATYPDRAELFREYPELEEEDIKQILEFAAASLSDEAVDFRVA
ncbi:MAG: DUF433 domain-containing protein [Candidatus Korobacteraceae bacterium]